MITKAVTSSQVTLIKRTDVISTHLIIFAYGRQTGRSFTVPSGKSIHHYIEDNYRLNVNIGTFGLAIRGRLEPCETHTTRGRTTDYTLIPAGGTLPRHDTARQQSSQLQRYVEQSDRAPGALAPLDTYGLGYGVPCDILHVRRQPISNLRVMRLRFSHLVHDELLIQYAHIHCLFDRIQRSGPTELAQVPHMTR